MCILYVFNQKRDVLIGKFTVISTLLSVNVPPGNTALAGTALLSDSLCSLLLHCADLPLRCVVSLLYSSIGKQKTWDALVEFKLLLVHTAYECMFLCLTLFKIKESLWKAYWASKVILLYTRSSLNSESIHLFMSWILEKCITIHSHAVVNNCSVCEFTASNCPRPACPFDFCSISWVTPVSKVTDYILL